MISIDVVIPTVSIEVSLTGAINAAVDDITYNVFINNVLKSTTTQPATDDLDIYIR